ncbi:MAG: VWA domain-containing protein, partial [Thiomargarita sp.]|nr:VWA domain-containing protein [Thiomargarita sp.]
MEPLTLNIKTLITTVPVANEETQNSILIRLEPAEEMTFGESKTKIALVLDNSGSMLGKPQADVVKTLGALIKYFRSTDWITGIAFGTYANTFYPLSNQHDTLQKWSDLDFYQS